MLGEPPVTLPANKRQGVSPGMFLVDYPTGSAKSDRWFFRFIDAYESWVHIVKRKI